MDSAHNIYAAYVHVYSLRSALSRITKAVDSSYVHLCDQLERSIRLEESRLSQFRSWISSGGKIEQLVYENRQHRVGSMLVPPSEYLTVNHIRIGQLSQPAQLDTRDTVPSRHISKPAAHDSCRRRFNGRNRRKKVTFKKDSELVTIREIPARDNRSDSSDNGASSDSSTEDDSDDSSDVDSSNDDDVTNGGDIVDQISKLVLRHTRDKPVKPLNFVRSIPPRPPRLRRPRVAAANKKIEKPQSKNQTRTLNNQNSSESARSQSASLLPAPSFGRLTQVRRPQSCATSQRAKVKRESPVHQRSTSAKPSLTLTTRTINGHGMSPMYGSLPSTNDRHHVTDGSNTNSGQERTKYYAWQVANGAPLVTTPGIAPLCAEQVTVTKLKK